ncbi:hypothetical protein A5874_000691, partial [Enterococcus faecium]
YKKDCDKSVSQSFFLRRINRIFLQI